MCQHTTLLGFMDFWHNLAWNELSGGVSGEHTGIKLPRSENPKSSRKNFFLNFCKNTAHTSSPGMLGPLCLKSTDFLPDWWWRDWEGWNISYIIYFHYIVLLYFLQHCGSWNISYFIYFHLLYFLQDCGGWKNKDWSKGLCFFSISYI